MSVSSTRTTIITFSGDVSETRTVAAATNSSSAGSEEVRTLASGANTITVPTGGTVPTGVTIQMPSGNTTSLTFKGVTGDTGVRLHNTDPTTFSLHSSVTTFVLTAGGSIAGVRLIWS